MYPKKYEPATEMFADILCDCFAFYTDCDYCGRNHFADPHPESATVSDMVLTNRISETNEPDKFVRHRGTATVAYGVVEGKRIVQGCPCDAIERHENFIWQNRELIAKFLKARFITEIKTAQATLATLKEIPNEKKS